MKTRVGGVKQAQAVEEEDDRIQARGTGENKEEVRNGDMKSIVCLLCAVLLRNYVRSCYIIWRSRRQETSCG